MEEKESSEKAEISDKNEEDELDKLLDDALDDFEKPQPKKKNKSIQYAEKEEKGKINLNNDPLFGNFLNDDALLKMSTDFNGVLEQMAKEDPAMMAEFQKFQETSGNDNGPFDFDENLAKAMEDLAKTMDGFGGDGSEESFKEMFKEMQAGMGSRGGGEDTNGDGFMGMMQGMMQNLLSKDLLYPSLKEIEDKYPSWLANNKEKINRDQYEKYQKQEQIVNQLCRLFEEEKETDIISVKKERQMKVVDLMQQMQKYGHPPADMMADIVGDEGTQATPPMPDCSIM